MKAGFLRGSWFSNATCLLEKERKIDEVCLRRGESEGKKKKKKWNVEEEVCWFDAGQVCGMWGESSQRYTGFWYTKVTLTPCIAELATKGITEMLRVAKTIASLDDDDRL